MKEKLKFVVVVLIFLGLLLGIGLGGWWIKRAFNWKFFYGKRFVRVEKKVDDLDRRVTVLELKFKELNRRCNIQPQPKTNN